MQLIKLIKTIAIEDEGEEPEDSEGIHVGIPQLEVLFKKLGTEEDTVTIAPKLSLGTHLFVKNQGGHS